MAAPYNIPIIRLASEIPRNSEAFHLLMHIDNFYRQSQVPIADSIPRYLLNLVIGYDIM